MKREARFLCDVNMSYLYQNKDEYVKKLVCNQNDE